MEDTCEILIRRVPVETRNTLKGFAGSLGLSLTDLLLEVLEETALPYSELHHAMIDRAEDVERSKYQGKLYLEATEPLVPARRRGAKL